MNGTSPQPPDYKIHASPSKDFFVTMITRDISLSDCVFDLLDNSIDGARRSAVKAGKSKNDLKGYWAKISISRELFSLTDNCGGISLSDAIDYAFHFGRKRDARLDVAGGIGIYGIGMKRAIFKIGRLAHIRSETGDDSFSVSVNVDEWVAQKDWDFEYSDKPKAGTVGTEIRIENLRPEIAKDFDDPAFKNGLARTIARDYSFLLSSGFEIRLQEDKIPPYKYELKSSDRLSPASVRYEDDGVGIRILAGLIDELSEEIPDELKPDKVDRYGWFVACNDRVVLAADKTERTIWGVDGYKVWHPQYNGFAGFVLFSCDDPRKLPWTTTKRDVDTADPLYRRTVVNMQKVTDTFIEYSNRRKTDVERAKHAESEARSVELSKLTHEQPKMLLPILDDGESVNKKADLVTISYKKPRCEVEEIAESLGNPYMSAKEVGRKTFGYYRSMELGK